MSVDVSIIIANYNNEKYIEDCLRSVQQQNFNNLEIVIVDDGSTDDSVKKIKQFIHKDSRFVLVQLEKNRGVSVARNTGLQRAKGKYITFLDSDDCMTPDAISILYDIACKHDADAVKAQRIKVLENFKLDKIPKNKHAIYKETVVLNPAKQMDAWFSDPMFVWLYLCKKSILLKQKFIKNMRPCEDVNFIIKLIPYINKLILVDYISVFYRLSDNSIMQNYVVSNKTIKSKLISFIDINNFFDANKNDCSVNYQYISNKLMCDLLLIDIFYIPLIERQNLLSVGSKIMQFICRKYSIYKYYNMRTRLAIWAFKNKWYKLARFWLDNDYFSKYTRLKKENIYEDTNC